MEPCKHEFHRTCAMKWFESVNYTKKWIDEHNCCLCRASTERVVNENGNTVYRSFPYENKEELLINAASLPAFDMEKRNDALNLARGEVSMTIKMLAHQKKLAQNNGKTGDYISDFDDEIKKFRKRSRSIDRILYSWTEVKALAATKKVDSSPP